jgi:hypothetical protein
MAMPTWVQEAGVIGTWVVGVLALFGDRIRAWLFRPDLHLELTSKIGSYSPQAGRQHDGAVVTRHARYYHLTVTNRARYPVAKDVHVLLLGVERLDQQTPPTETSGWYVPLPLGWAYGGYPLAREIGRKTEAIADLLFVRGDKLEFVPIHTPLNFQKDYSGKTRLRVTAVARGTDCESNILKLEIEWNGLWERDDDAMKKHFVIRAA